MKKLGIFGTICAFLFLVLGVVKADALTISPVREEIALDPGEVFVSEYVVYNDEEVPVTVYGSFENFEAQGETGTASFLPGDEGLASWMSGPIELDLAPKERRTVTYRVDVPDDADPGGYYAAVFWGTQPRGASSGSNVRLSSRLGMLVLLTVNGDIPFGGELLEYKSIETRDPATGNAAPIIDKKSFNTLPASFLYRYQNSGGDRVKPDGEVIVRNLFGIKKATLDANDREGNILPSSIRRFEVTWGEYQPEPPTGFFAQAGYQWKNFAFGPQRATLVIPFENTALDPVKQSVWIWVWPWQLVILVVVIAVAAFFSLRFGIRRYNRYIIRQAQKFHQHYPPPPPEGPHDQGPLV